MKRGKLKVIPAEVIVEIKAQDPSLLQGRICSRCLMRQVVSDDNLCRDCRRELQRLRR